MAKHKLLSGRVKTTPAANVTADRYDFLGLEQAEPNLGTAAQDGYVLIYDSNAPGKRNWSSSSLLSGGITAQSAFESANSASSYANSAFIVSNSAAIYANSAFVSANSASSYANGAFITANSASNYANASFETANSAGVYANAAFDKANSANILAQASFNTANLKFNTSGGTISGDVTITGNLTIEGNTVIVNVSTLAVEDSIIQLARNNTSDAVDIGFLGHYDAGSGNVHAGLIRRASDDTFYLFDNLTTETLTNVVDIANSSIATLRANLISNNVLIRGYDPVNHTNNAYQVANSGSSYANGAFAAANTADQKAVTSGSYANSAYQTANSGSSYANGAFAAANTADQRAVTSGIYANSAFAAANSNYTSAVTRLTVTNSGASAFLIDQYTGNNPTIYVSAGETIAFQLSGITGHPFMIRVSSGGSNYDTGLTHVSTTGTVSTDSSAQAKESGTLYWKVPFDLVGLTYVYQCQAHSGMVGSIVIQQPASFVASNTQLAFTAANTADQRAVTSGSYANSSYIHANAAFNAANSATDTWVRNAANAASSYANSAYAQANTGTTLAQAAFDQANTGGGAGTDSYARNTANAASSYANSAYLHANAAFNAANTGGAATDSFARTQANAAFNQANSAASGGQTIYVAAIDTFTSNGQNTTFTLSTTPTSANQIMVYIDGVYQQSSGYTLSGATLTMSEAVDANSSLQVRTFANTATSQLGVTIDTFTGTGACTTFTLSTVPTSKNLTSVIVGGVPQLKSAYSITGTSLVFTGAPANNSVIEVATYKGGGSYATSFTAVVDKFTGNGAQTTFGLSTIPNSENETFVYLNGVYQNKDTYSVSGANVVLTGTATSNDTIEVVTVAGSEMNVTSSRYNSRVYTGTGACTQFTISSSHSANSVLVFENGICQEPITDYTVSGTTLTFTTAPGNGFKIQIRELPV